MVNFRCCCEDILLILTIERQDYQILLVKRIAFDRKNDTVFPLLAKSPVIKNRGKVLDVVCLYLSDRDFPLFPMLIISPVSTEVIVRWISRFSDHKTQVKVGTESDRYTRTYSSSESKTFTLVYLRS